MNPLVRFLLRAKHWQVFLIFALLWLAAVVAMIVPMLRSPQEALDNLLPFFAAMELGAIFFALWLWSVGAFLNAPTGLSFRAKTTLFRALVLVVPIYLPIFGFFFRGMSGVDVRLALISLAVIIPLHFLVMFCQIYSCYFVSKGLASAEHGRPALLSDYIGYFVCLWFFPVGIWIVQPRINRLYVAMPSQSTP